ncbi:hypothetical protein MKI84_12845 [Ancylobacter sp. A5.8]|uniref:hypothetical protein n=1 Tax=Ancylobacter gelatini TaxID=2919920 RepID=UPI001F4D9F59|nr:hypothetical protein [Ancylobacter gelatini]MCJ8143804.1 hypothetical protein [Ancylobacter gelatini]
MSVRPHPRIPPRIRRPVRDRVELVVQLEPIAGDPVMPIVIALDAATGCRMLADLMDAFQALWLDKSNRENS